MSLIETFKEAKALAKSAREFAERAKFEQAHDSSRYYDKFGVTLRIENSWAGAYGSSSSYDWNEDLKAEFLRQIKVELRELVMHMALRLEAEAEEARQAAISEAEEVLRGAAK